MSEAKTTYHAEELQCSKYKARDLNPAFANGRIVENDYWGERWREMHALSKSVKTPAVGRPERPSKYLLRPHEFHPVTACLYATDYGRNAHV